MKLCFSLLLVLMIVPAAYAREPQKKWSFCETADDCVVVGAGCAIGAVHKAYQVEADKYYSEINSKIECAVIRKKEDMAVECKNQRQGCKTFWGGYDPASTCVSARKLCGAVLRSDSLVP